MTVKAILAILLVLTLSACSDSPAVSEARMKVEQQISDNSNGVVRLVSFEKTDGQQFDSGSKRYKMSYVAEVEFLADCRWYGSDRMMKPFEAYAFPDATRFASLGPVVGGRKGERRKVVSTIEFQKTERGWQ